MMDFMNDLVTRGWMQSSKYVRSVQAGTEVFTGTGQLDTRGYLLPHSVDSLPRRSRT